MENNKVENVIVKEVSCSGDEFSAHPKVYLHIVEETGKVVCPYCSKTFIYSADK